MRKMSHKEQKFAVSTKRVIKVLSGKKKKGGNLRMGDRKRVDKSLTSRVVISS